MDEIFTDSTINEVPQADTLPDTMNKSIPAAQNLSLESEVDFACASSSKTEVKSFTSTFSETEGKFTYPTSLETTMKYTASVSSNFEVKFTTPSSSATILNLTAARSSETEGKIIIPPYLLF